MVFDFAPNTEKQGVRTNRIRLPFVYINNVAYIGQTQSGYSPYFVKKENENSPLVLANCNQTDIAYNL